MYDGHFCTFTEKVQITSATSFCSTNKGDFMVDVLFFVLLLAFTQPEGIKHPILIQAGPEFLFKTKIHYAKALRAAFIVK